MGEDMQSRGWFLFVLVAWMMTSGAKADDSYCCFYEVAQEGSDHTYYCVHSADSEQPSLSCAAGYVTCGGTITLDSNGPSSCDATASCAGHNYSGCQWNSVQN